MRGLEVEEIRRLERQFHGVVVARVLSVEPHPSANKLSVCRVNDGRGERTVVCGAPNVKAGVLYPLAVPGARLGNITIQARELRGVFSEGMLCSEAELGLSERGDGLMELGNDAVPGTDVDVLLGETDTMLDISVTANRPDCLGVIGMARELAAALGRPLRRPLPSLTADPAAENQRIDVEIRAPQRCPRYTGRFIDGVTPGPSPRKMAERLAAVGIRSINNIVDVTNYVMMETGQPLHAFDAALIQGKKIIVRLAEEGERFVTLDGKEHELDSATLLICDGERPVALAGIMGGKNSEVSDETRAVFLESAYFEPVGIRKTCGRLGISSESSRRFERGVDPHGALYALNRAAQLILETAGGRLIGEAVDVHPLPAPPVVINLSTKRCNELLGIQQTRDETAALLVRLEIRTTPVDDDVIAVQVPSFRVDLKKPVDLIEEVARHIGYDALPTEPAPRINQLQEANAKDAFRDYLRRTLAGAGFRETVAYNLVPRKIAEAFLPEGFECVALLNPLSADLEVFRTDILQSLIATAVYNRNRQMQDLSLFEIGESAWKLQGKIEERTQVGGLYCGMRLTKEWNQPPAAFDFYDVKGAVEHLLRAVGIADVEITSPREPIWDAEAVGLLSGGNYLGSYGKIRREICALFKLKTCDLYAFRLDFSLLFEQRRLKREYQPVPRFPSSPFDLALILDRQVPVGRLEQAIREAGKPYLASIHLFDLYVGEQVPAGKKSAAFSLTFSSKERTLNEDEVNEAVERILARLKEEFGAELRPS